MEIMIIIKKNSKELIEAIRNAKRFIKTTFNGVTVETETTREYTIEELKNKHAFVNLINGKYVINDIKETIEIL
jgi:hypothetical protein